MDIALWIVQGFLAVLYLVAGASKVFRTTAVKEQAAWAGRSSDGYVRFIGIVEILGALGLVLPVLTGILPWLTPVAALGLALVQLLAIVTVSLRDKDYKALAINLVLLAMALFVAYGRFVGLS